MYVFETLHLGGAGFSGRVYLRVNSRGLSNVTDFEAEYQGARDKDGEIIDDNDALSPFSALLISLLAVFYFTRVKGRKPKN